MLRLPYITPRSGGLLVTVLLVIKLVLLIWNAAVFDGTSYDAVQHEDRALFGGLRPGKLAADAPLYYLPASLLPRPDDVPMLERSPDTLRESQAAVAGAARPDRPKRASKSEKLFRSDLLSVLRYTNVFWLGLFYLAWILYAFPRLLLGFEGRFLASLLLLAIPGYQKLGVMSHPDNMFAATASVAVCCWLFLRERWQKSQRSAAPSADAAPRTPPGFGLGHLIVFALAIGLTALTRPFAIVPVAVLSVVAAVYLVRLVGLRWERLLPRVLLIGAIIGVMSASWPLYRWQHAGERNAFATNSATEVESQRASFDFVEYFTTFKLGELLDDPSGKGRDGDGNGYFETQLAGSFFTLLYSEVWGDQWLYFSGSRRDSKIWPKRLILATAVAVPLIACTLGGLFWWDLFRRARNQLREVSGGRVVARFFQLSAKLEQDLVLLALAVLGAALFVYWQAGPALLPGENSTVKFIHFAALLPPALALVFSPKLKPLAFNLLAGYFLVLYICALPLAMYWPK